MRENDDDAPVTEPQGSLVDGLGETAEPGAYESSGDPYGETDFGDDTYGDDTSGDDDSYGDDTSGDDDSYGTDDSYGDDDAYDTDGTYGDGDGSSSEDDTDATVDDVDTTVVDDDSTTVGDEDLLAQDNSPLEGIGFLIEEVRDALFGDDEAAAGPFDTDPVDLETDTDLDLTGDGVIDRADLHEAASSFDFDVSTGAPHHGHHDDGVIDA